MFSNFDLENFVRNIITSGLIIVGAILVWVVISRFIGMLEKKPRVSKTLLLPLRLFARYGIIVIALLLILSSYGIPIGNFWTFISTVVGLIAIGFVAVWSVLSNVSATFLILLIQPFRVGDYVRIVGDEVTGDVIDIDFLFTTIRSRRGDVFKVPNNQFFQKASVQPADPETYERKLFGGEGEKGAVDPHKDQNLEGIKLSPGKGR